jgi:HEAT repeat protein
MRSRIALAVVLGALPVGLAGLVLRPREPSYQGRPLTSWLRQYFAHSDVWDRINMQPVDEQGKQAGIAIRLIGTNAIPTLLQMLQASDPPWKFRILDFLGKQSIIKSDRLRAAAVAGPGVTVTNADGSILEISGFPPATLAACGFTVLGADAREAVPALIKIYERDSSERSEGCVAHSLAAIGPPAGSAIPALIKGMTNSSLAVRALSINALSRIHADPEIVVPALIKCLSDIDNDAEVDDEAAVALGSFGAAAKPAIPALIELLQHPGPDLHYWAGIALSQIDPEAAAKAGVEWKLH